jgi:DNA polymerase III delta prime subunit
MLVGHEGVTKALSLRLPPVSIITGPPSVGKRLVAAHAAISNNVARVDFTEVKRLTVEEAARIKKFMVTHPMSNLKFALIDLDSATNAAMNDLLKTLEEPPEYARFSLISSKRVPPTLLTRGQKYSVGLLNSDELFEILIHKGIPENDARSLSKLGRVDLALQAYSAVAARATALNVLQSVDQNDYELFVQAFKAVDEKAASMIITFLEESAAQRWKRVDPKYLGVFKDRRAALTVLAAWSNVTSARPQLAVRTALESIMRG